MLAGGLALADALVGLALAAACAALIGWRHLRMSGHYLPLATIAWGIALYYLFGNLPWLGKYDGIADIRADVAVRLGFDSGRESTTC